MFRRSKTVPLLLVIAALGGSLVMKLAHRKPAPVKDPVVWSATREERLLVLDILDRLEIESPELLPELLAARDQALDDRRDLNVNGTRLSRHFFESDSLTQNRILRQAVHKPSSSLSRINRKAPGSE